MEAIHACDSDELCITFSIGLLVRHERQTGVVTSVHRKRVRCSDQPKQCQQHAMCADILHNKGTHTAAEGARLVRVVLQHFNSNHGTYAMYLGLRSVSQYLPSTRGS